MLKQRAFGAGFVALALSTSFARGASAAGYDTPILYTARHQAMGGAAIGYVDDPSATFHNPAGLQGVDGLALLGDLSLLIGSVKGTPERTIEDEESNSVVAPFFLVGAGYRAHEWLTVGLGFFPVASGGAEYEYDLLGTPFVDRTQILFLEVTPAVSLNVPKDKWLPGKLAIGAGYRIDWVRFQREKGDPDDPRVLALDMSGASFTGFRVGVQYRPIPVLGFGVVFRNRVDVTTKADEVSVFTQTATDAELEFILPAKLGFGVELALDRIRVATDVEYAFQSQNDRVELKGTLSTGPAAVPNIFDWKNGVTARVGAEYAFGAAIRYPVRIGYAFDSAVTNPAYPTAFGTPAAPTHSFGGGAGINPGPWQVNAAVVHRFGSASIEASELGTGCQFCSYAGDYSLTMTGIYVDASVEIDL
jgi:long-chain fatty acid transport protein